VLARIRALGLAKASLVAGLAISTVVFAVMSYEGFGGGVIAGVLLQVLLIVFVQQGLDRVERAGFSIAAVTLGLLALVIGRFADRLTA
jgi:uncharacterized membrane protein